LCLTVDTTEIGNRLCKSVVLNGQLTTGSDQLTTGKKER